MRHSSRQIVLAGGARLKVGPLSEPQAAMKESAADLQSPAWQKAAHPRERFAQLAEPVSQGWALGKEPAPARQPEPVPYESTWKWILPAESSAGNRAAVQNRSARFVPVGHAVPVGHFVLDGLIVPSAAAAPRAVFPLLAGQTLTLACVRHAGRDGDAGRASHPALDFRNS